MTSNNLDEKVLLQYISRSLANWGITHIDSRVLRRGKENSEEAVQPLTRLLLDLVVLHCFDYTYTCDELGIGFEEEGEMWEIIMAHLYQVQSPFVVELGQNQEGETQVGFDFSSSRHVMLACGWLMGVSSFFNRTLGLFAKKFNAIYKPKALDLDTLGKKYMTAPRAINLHEESSKIDRISFLAKTLRVRNHSVECLAQKKQKIIDRLRAKLKQMDEGLTLQDFLGTCDSGEIEQRESELREMMAFEKKNMGYRKYWWIWLDSKIITLDYKQLSQTYENFEKLQYPTERINNSIRIDLTYLPRYFESSSRHSGQLDEIAQKMRALELKERKKYKEVEQDVLYELKQAREAARQGRDVFPSFIALQLKKHMKLQQTAPQPAGKSTKKGKDRQQVKLAQQIKKFIGQIEDIVII